MKKLKPLLILSVIGLFILQSCTTVKPVGTIKADDANNMEELFKQTRSSIINTQLGYEDTREVWFSLEKMKQYIAYVESEAKKKNLPNLGLRVYYGAYPANENGQTFSTIFFVPTTKAENEKQTVNKTAIAVTSSSGENENIYTIDALNYGGLGHPPKEYTPND